MPVRSFRTLTVFAITLLVPLLPLSAFAQTQASAIASPALIQFDVPAGPLADALTAFERASGVTVQTVSSLDQLTSRGVRGALTAADALSRLVEGTGLAPRVTPSGAFVLEPASPAHRVETTGQLPRYVAEESRSATRTNTRLLDVPQTINVVPRALLEDQHAQSVADAVRNVPGVSIAQGEGNRDQLMLRGISTASDFFVNGVRDDQERFRDLYNVESVEVVQGPAAVLFGRGGAGGLVNLVTTPTQGSRSEFNVEIGEYRHKRATARLGTSIGANAFLRVNGMAEDSGGFRDDYFLHRHAINPVARVTLGSQSSVTFSFEHLRDHRLADRGIPSQAGRPADVARSQLFGSADQNEAKSGVDSAAVTLEHRLGTSVRLRNSFLAGRYDKFYQNVYPGSAVNAAGNVTLSAYNHAMDRTNVFNQADLIVEGRVAGIAHVLLAGVEAGRQAQDETRRTAASIANVPVTDSVRNANFAAAPLAVNRTADATTLATYVQDQIAFLSRWKAIAGVRLDRFAVAIDDFLPANADLSRVDVAASPRAGLIYQPNTRTSIYSSYSYTFLPSGEKLGLAANTAELRPENAKNYELGAKLDVLASRLTLATAVFRLDRDNVKSVDPIDPTRLVLTGQQRTDGFTLSASGRVNQRWELSGGYADLDARITKTTSAAPAGRRPGLVPRHQASLWSAHDITRTFRLAAGIVSQAETFTSFTNTVRLPGYTRVDASAFYRIRNATLSLGVTNLFDTRYYPTANGDNNISPGAPRTLQLSLRHVF
jgi:catecholate siderophore receptor